MELKKKVSSLLGQFQVHSKIERKITEISIYPLFPHVHNLPHYDIPHQSGTFCTIDESTLTCCNQLESIVYIRVALGVVHSVGLDRCIMTCIHQYVYHQSGRVQVNFPKNPLCSACSPSLPLLEFLS